MEDGKTPGWSTFVARYPIPIRTRSSTVPSTADEDYALYKATRATVSLIEQSRADGRRAREALERAGDLAAKEKAEEELIAATEQLLEEPARSGIIYGYASSEPQYIGPFQPTKLQPAKLYLSKQEWDDILKWSRETKITT